MNKKSRRTLLLLSVVVAVSIMWFLRAPLGGLLHKEKLIPAGEILERCYSLKEGNKIHYQFKGAQMVSFDIRRGGDSMMPPRLIPFDQGDFTADSDGEYCLRFGNPLNQAQAIEYSVERLKQ